MQNKSVYIVTGATGGIGKEIAIKLAKDGRCVMLACRDEEKAKLLKNEITIKTGNKNILIEHLNLNSFSSIRDFVNRISGISIQALVNNAGVMCRRYFTTEDEIEETMAVNYFGTVLLTELLLSQMEDGGRIVFTTSVTRRIHRLVPNILNVSSRDFSQLGTYGRSKYAITLYAQYLAHCLKESGVSVNCSDPGIVDSGMITMNRWFDPIANIIFRPLISNPKSGAEVALKALQEDCSSYIFTQSKQKKMSNAFVYSEGYKQIIDATYSILKIDR